MSVYVEYFRTNDRHEKECKPELPRDIPIQCTLYGAGGKCATDKAEAIGSPAREHLEIIVDIGVSRWERDGNIFIEALKH